VDLKILFEGDPFLLNVYHVLTVNPEKWPNINLAGAKAFADYVTSPEGQPDADKTGAELGLP